MAVTIREIAARTGLSIPTVGNVLGRSAHRYSPATQEKVIRTARELGYRPNSSAKAMSSGRSGCAVLVLSRNRRLSDVPQHLIEGLEDELVQNDMHLSLTRLPDQEFAETDCVPKVLRESLADGLIINYTHCFPKQMVDLVEWHKTPTVWVNVKLPHDCVHPDDFGAAVQATEYLQSIGHRRIAYLHLTTLPGNHPAVSFEEYSQMDHYSIADRRSGYTVAMERAGLAPRFLAADRFVEFQDYLPFCRSVLEQPDRPTAILTYHQIDAETALIAASSLGLRIPQDLSILTFDSELFRRTAGLRFSTIMVPAEQEGRHAVRMLVKKINKPEEKLPAEAVPLTLVAGDTAAPLK